MKYGNELSALKPRPTGGRKRASNALVAQGYGGTTEVDQPKRQGMLDEGD